MSNDDWQNAVRQLMLRSAAVVFTVGHTQSLGWEINTAVSAIPNDRLLFFFPYASRCDIRNSLFQKYWTFITLGLITKTMMKRMDSDRQGRYLAFREKTRSLFPASPASLGASQFIDFSRSGAPRLIEFKRTYKALIFWSFFKASYMQKSFRRTLSPFVKKLRLCS